MPIKRVGVLGCGLMGSGIAQVSAAAGYSTVVKEVADEFLKKGLASIDKSLSRLADKGTITAEKRSETLGRLKGTTKFEDLADCDIIIEAVTENLQVKRETYSTLDQDGEARSHFCEQYFIFDHYGDDDRYQTGRPIHRVAFFQSGSSDEAGRGRGHNHNISGRS